MTPNELNEIFESIIPSWQRAEFHFLEPIPMWAPSVESELVRMIQTTTAAAGARSFGGIAEVYCHSHTDARSIFEQIKRDRCDGIILLAKDQMRDVLLCLGRLTRLCRRSPPVLVIIPPDALTLMPLLLESGATGVICEPVQDTDVARWCRQISSVGQQ